jgi:MFS family permease
VSGQPHETAWGVLRGDSRVLFATRAIRLFAYGFLSVQLVLFLDLIRLSPFKSGMLLTLTLLGDAVVSVLLTTHADRMGRRRTLLIGAALMLGAGVVFAVVAPYTNPDVHGWLVANAAFVLLLLAATIGVISPSGNEIGPFLSVEQAALSQLVPGDRRTSVFAWYNLVGSAATALGALAAGGLTQLLTGRMGLTLLTGYRVIVVCYAAAGVVLLMLFLLLGPQVEVVRTSAEAKPAEGLWLGLHKSRKVVLKLSALFSLDAFAGGFVIQSLLAFWFQRKFNLEPAMLGAIFFAANLFAACSALAAGWVASKIGLINTMVFTHLPSNVLLILVPLMPNLPLAIAMLLARFSISQMDVPTRQSYTMAVVDPDERSAAAGVTGIARSIGASISPLFVPLFISVGWVSLPFYLGGGLKIVYDLLLYRSFTRK